MTTMHDMYGDGSDHIACTHCGLCSTCGDCECNPHIGSSFADFLREEGIKPRGYYGPRLPRRPWETGRVTGWKERHDMRWADGIGVGMTRKYPPPGVRWGGRWWDSTPRGRCWRWGWRIMNARWTGHGI
jgi:hypothetical protein